MCDGHPRDPEACCIRPYSRAECESHVHDGDRDYFGSDDGNDA